jgi:hypothetical protein
MDQPRKALLAQVSTIAGCCGVKTAKHEQMKQQQRNTAAVWSASRHLEQLGDKQDLLQQLRCDRTCANASLCWQLPCMLNAQNLLLEALTKFSTDVHAKQL